MNNPEFGVTPLGVTIARKQQQQQLVVDGEPDQFEKEQLKKFRESRNNNSDSSTRSYENLDAANSSATVSAARNSHRPKQLVTTTTYVKKSNSSSSRKGSKGMKDEKPKNASWMALVEGVTLYGLCLVVPSLLGIVMRLDRLQIEDLVMWGKMEVCARSAWICWHVFGMALPPPEDEIVLTFDNFAPDAFYVSDIYVIGGLTLTMALVRVLLVHWLVPNHLAPQQMEALVRCKSIHLLSSQYKESLTPRETPRKVIDFSQFQTQSRDNDNHNSNRNRPASIPSLSLPPMVATSSPPQWNRPAKTPTKDDTISTTPPTDGNNQRATPPSYLQQRYDNHDSTGDLVGLGLSMDTPIQMGGRPTLQLDEAQVGGFLQSCSPGRAGSEDGFNNTFVLDGDNNGVADHAVGYRTPTLSPIMAPQTPTTPPFSNNDNHLVEEEEETFDWKRRGSTASLAAAAAAAVQEGEDDDEHHDADDDGDYQEDDATPLQESTAASGTSSPVSPVPNRRRRPQRLFAAPRYATAVFRLLYCTLSCITALYFFRDADFWPSSVGGQGSTEQCWDLSGSLSLAKNLDSDFDHRNTVLRRFFLVQASYHLHSGAFHIFSVLLLHLLQKGDSKDDGEKKSKRDWTSDFLRALVHPRAVLQHSLPLLFLSVSYVFSSLRRLGAIGMFALDISNWAMHLLQTCLNAPTNSRLSQPKVIRGVWALLVVPSFLYFRFWVWPLLGYSATVESERWLAQLESTLVPGSALWFRRAFQVWMALWMGFHAVHFKRLVFHPHIQRIMLSSTAQDGNKQVGK